MSAFQVLTETNAVSVAILNVKIAATVGLVADITRDLHALRLEFSIERISIVDPNVGVPRPALDRKSTRLNSSHLVISYAVFCLKKKKKNIVNELLSPTRK